MKTTRTYTTIQEKRITLPHVNDPFICYSVTIVSECDYSLFGHTFKRGKSITKLPFLFKSLEVAKDFCEINPKFKSVVISNKKYIDHVYYYTYELYNNENERIGHIYFDKNFISIDTKHGDVYYKPNVIETPLIDQFVHEISVPDLFELREYSDRKNAIGWIWHGANKLTDLINATMPTINDTNVTYTYEMIEK